MARRSLTLEKRVARNGIHSLSVEERALYEQGRAAIARVLPQGIRRQRETIQRIVAQAKVVAQEYKQLTPDERRRYRHSDLTVADVMRLRGRDCPAIRPSARAPRARRRNVRTSSRRSRAPASSGDPSPEPDLDALAVASS